MVEKVEDRVRSVRAVGPAARPRTYIGLASTGHENALAVIDESGHLLFAEATERPTQIKRAVNVPPDDPFRIGPILDAYADPDSDLVVARSWSADAERRISHDAGVVRSALRGRRGASDAEWIRRVLFQLQLWPSLIGPNQALAGAAIDTLALMSGRKVVKRAFSHHLTHASYAASTSGFDRAVVAVFDGFGEGRSHDYFLFDGARLAPLEYRRTERNRFGSLASLGLFYGMTICGLFGFHLVNGEEWKVMGLAPYGRRDELLYQLFNEHLYVDGLDLAMDERAADALRGMQQFRKRDDQSFEDVANVAFTAQEYFGELMLKLLANLHAETGEDDLVLGGGCALNSSVNGRLAVEGSYARTHIPSAPSDDGNAIGAALLAYQHDHPDDSGPSLANAGPYLGSPVDERQLAEYLVHGDALGLVVQDEEESLTYAAEALVKGKVVAWMQGRAEFGPRALGNRSILADPRNAEAKNRINRAVKFREDFRPFAPSVLDEAGAEYFEQYIFTPHMERTLVVRRAKRAEIPAVCHVDGTARLHSVKRDGNPRFHRLLVEFGRRTGVPVLLNTSLNVMGKPIVHSVADAMTLYLTSGVDLLVVNDCVFDRHAMAGGGREGCAS